MGPSMPLTVGAHHRLFFFYLNHETSQLNQPLSTFTMLCNHPHHYFPKLKLSSVSPNLLPSPGIHHSALMVWIFS